MQLWLQTDDAKKADHSAVLTGAPAINLDVFKNYRRARLQTHCWCMTSIDLGSNCYVYSCDLKNRIFYKFNNKGLISYLGAA